MDKLNDKIESLLRKEEESRNSYYELFIGLEKDWMTLFQNWNQLKSEYSLTRAFILRVYLAYESEYHLKQKITYQIGFMERQFI